MYAKGVSTQRGVCQTPPPDKLTDRCKNITLRTVTNYVFLLHNSGSAGLDEVLTVLLSTAMLLAGVLAFVLDNLLPGMCYLGDRGGEENESFGSIGCHFQRDLG